MDSTLFHEDEKTEPPKSPASNHESDDSTSVLPWTKDKVARERTVTMFSSFYALILVIMGVVLELSRTLRHKQHSLARFKDMLFAVYVYGGGLIFFIYCYSVLLNSRWSRPLVSRISSEVGNSPKANQMSENHTFLFKASHSNPTTGSLYLRLGCIAFGIFGVVYYGLNVLLCLFGWGKEHGNDCNGYTITISSFAICFIFVQMHFVFSNSKMTIHGSKNIARLGIMHLVAANIWTWIRYILIEEQKTKQEIDHVKWNTSHHHSTDMEELEERCHGVECVLGDFSELMYTCVVEYSLICAGVMFVAWTNVGFTSNTSSDKRNHVIKVDCSKTTTGLFSGLAFLVLTFISMGLFNAFIFEKNNLMASWVFFGSDAILFFLASIACIFAFWRMKDLNFSRHDVEARESAELLDRLLLIAGFIGELLFSMAGLVGLTGDRTWTVFSVLLVLAHVLRLVQVCLQSGLLLLAEKLKIEDPKLRDPKPGKQVITFLLVANAALFLMNTFEAQKAGISPEIVHFYGIQSWVMLVRSCAPLTIFYRFHSSVCFAEVWKHSFTVKEEQEMSVSRQITNNETP